MGVAAYVNGFAQWTRMGWKSASGAKISCSLTDITPSRKGGVKSIRV